MCSLNSFECIQSRLLCWWLTGVSISYAGVLYGFALDSFHQLFMRLKENPASKLKWTELHLSFSCFGSAWHVLFWMLIILWSIFLYRVSEESDMSWKIFFYSPFFCIFFCIFFIFFLLIYLDELLKLLLSCHKRLLSEWTYRTKASDAKRWNRGISLHLNWACLYSSLFISPACLASACQCVWLFRCYVNVLFSQTQAVTLWASLCLHTDGISVLHPPSYIKFATGPL